MTTELEVPQENDLALMPQFHAVAVNATEMKAANEGIKTWLRAKVSSIESEIAELEAQLDAARRHKWKTSTFQGMIQRTKQKHLYYGKLLAACEAGFTIVPNMDLDVFAIRVKREKPAAKPSEDWSKYGKANPRISDEEEQRLPVGEGRYESPSQTVNVKRWDEKDEKGELIHKGLMTPVDFAEMEFPLAVAHSVVMDVTARAMAMKIFDRIGVVPRTRNGDPIVLGQITRKEGYGTKTASFLIAWYLDPRTL